MKALRLSFIVVICGAMLHANSYADPSDRHHDTPMSGKADRMDAVLAEAKHRDERADTSRRLPGRDQLKPVPQNHTDGFQIRNAAAPGRSPPELSRVATAGSGVNKIETRHESPTRLPISGGRNVPSPNAVRYRSPTPAVLGGAATSSAGTTAALNGTGMNRKRY